MSIRAKRKSKDGTEHRCKINVLDQTGDSIVTTFDPDVAETCEVPQKALEDFWDKCVREHQPANIFGRVGTEWKPFIPTTDKLVNVEEIIRFDPLRGG